MLAQRLHAYDDCFGVLGRIVYRISFCLPLTCTIATMLNGRKMSLVINGGRHINRKLCLAVVDTLRCMVCLHIYENHVLVLFMYLLKMN